MKVPRRNQATAPIKADQETLCGTEITTGKSCFAICVILQYIVVATEETPTTLPQTTVKGD